MQCINKKYTITTDKSIKRDFEYHNTAITEVLK